MKKFFAVILLALALSPDRATACIDIGTHNYYLFDILDGSLMKDRRISERCNQFWRNYTNQTADTYLWSKDDIMKIAQQRGDHELISYMEQLNKYLAISDELEDAWTYPTKAELAARQQTLQQMAAKAFAYKGTRLKSQWALLYMRANMVMKKHQTNVNYWKDTASKLPDNVYREMMENIYAGALLHTGHRKESIDIFLSQGDFTSVRWLMRKARNLDGIKSIYADDPKSPVLLFLVQDFVNNTQETIDNTDNETNTIQEEWMKTIDARVIRQTEAEQFISFAQQVIKEGKNPYPAMWQAAIGELQYLKGDRKSAVKTLTQAIDMAGTPRMKDNARRIRLVAAVGADKNEKKSARWIADEMEWLVSKANEAKADGNSYDSPYSRTMERLVYMELIPMYNAQGNINMVTGLYNMMSEGDRLWTKAAPAPDPNSTWNDNYFDWSGYSAVLGRLSGDQLVAYGKWTSQRPANGLEAFVKERIGKDPTYFNDMAGTRYIAEGKFKEAIPLLKQVPLTFMEGQNISFYLAKRDYTKGRWFGRQKFAKGVETEGPHLAKLTHNPKVAFCEEVLQLQSQYTLAKNGERERIALELARRYYQVSHLGDCWYITHYGHSICDTVEEGEMDFVTAARQLLRESCQSANFDIKQESLFALAFIPNEAMSEGGGWSDSVDWLSIANNRDQQDLAALNAFYLQNKGKVARYITKCDVLKCFSNN